MFTEHFFFTVRIESIPHFKHIFTNIFFLFFFFQVKINKADIQRLNELLDQLRLLNLCKMAGNSPFLSSLLCQQQPLDDSSNAGSYASPASKTAPPTTYPKMWTQSWAQSASLQFQQLQRKPQRLLSNEEIIKRLRGHHTKLRNVTPAGMLNNWRLFDPSLVYIKFKKYTSYIKLQWMIFLWFGTGPF